MRPVLTAAFAVAVGITAGGCHHAPTPVPETSTSAVGMSVGSAGDVAFLENIVVHHQQGLELAAMVRGQSADPELAVLADRIAAQQRMELQGCQAQLLQWEAPGGRPGQDHPDDIPGMLDMDTMDTLRSLRGPQFDNLWLRSMIAHHRGAITLAQNEIEHGESPEAISIAHSLLPFQQAEINQMNRLLGVP